MIRTLLALVVVAVMGSGCASYLIYDGSRSIVQERKNMAIRANALPGGGAGIGIDLLNLDALTERPWLQLGAAVVDAGILYYGYNAVDAANDRTNKKNKTTVVTVTGNGNNTTVVNGDGNSENGSQDNSDTTSK